MPFRFLREAWKETTECGVRELGRKSTEPRVGLVRWVKLPLGMPASHVPVPGCEFPKLEPPQKRVYHVEI